MNIKNVKTLFVLLFLLIAPLATADDWGDSGSAGSDWGDSGSAGSDWGDSGSAGSDWGDSGSAGSDWGDSGSAGSDSGGSTDWGNDWNSGDNGNTDFGNDWSNPPGSDWNNDPQDNQNDWTPQPQNPPQPTNNAPVLASIGNKAVNEGQFLQFTITATDADNDPLTFTAANIPAGASFSGQTFSWTPDLSQAGSYTVTFTVADSKGATDSETIQITIFNVGDVPPPPPPPQPQPINNVPIILTQPVTDATVGRPYTYRVMVFDADADAIRFSLEQAPDGMEINDVFSNAVVLWEIVEEDEQEEFTSLAGTTYSITLNDVDDETCDVIVNGQRFNAQEGSDNVLADRANFIVSFANEDDDECFFYIRDPRVTVAFLDWVPSGRQRGENPVTLAVSDGKATVRQSFTINVTVDAFVTGSKDEQPDIDKNVHVATIALPDYAQQGETITVTLSFENDGNDKLDDVKAKVTIPELGIRSPSVGPIDIRVHKDVSRTLVLEIPEDAEPGTYTVRVTIDGDSVHRVIHREIEILEY
ncbi:putative Ig domain-containing protein [Candidatus Woesearchaeota archaeon]|nr:putative Ig domain-containing protein [Candidatus Woesearchaeota archaeon]